MHESRGREEEAEHTGDTPDNKRQKTQEEIDASMADEAAAMEEEEEASRAAAEQAEADRVASGCLDSTAAAKAE